MNTSATTRVIIIIIIIFVLPILITITTTFSIRKRRTRFRRSHRKHFPVLFIILVSNHLSAAVLHQQVALHLFQPLLLPHLVRAHDVPRDERVALLLEVLHDVDRVLEPRRRRVGQPVLAVGAPLEHPHRRLGRRRLDGLERPADVDGGHLELDAAAGREAGAGVGDAGGAVGVGRGVGLREADDGGGDRVEGRRALGDVLDRRPLGDGPHQFVLEKMMARNSHRVAFDVEVLLIVQGRIII